MKTLLMSLFFLLVISSSFIVSSSMAQTTANGSYDATIKKQGTTPAQVPTIPDNKTGTGQEPNPTTKDPKVYEGDNRSKTIRNANEIWDRQHPKPTTESKKDPCPGCISH
jgi:hypothetical protein